MVDHVFFALGVFLLGHVLFVGVFPDELGAAQVVLVLVVRTGCAHFLTSRPHTARIVRYVDGVAHIQYEIPDDIHRQAKAAAAVAGITLKDYIIAAITAANQKGKK